MTDLLQIEGILLMVDKEKAFDSVNRLLLASTLEKYGLKNDFIRWIKLLLKNQELCIINALEIAFIKIKRNANIKSLNVCNNDFLYTAYADDTTFFLQNEKSAAEFLNNFNIMAQFFGLKANKWKCEVAEIRVMKGVKVALCGVECVIC